MATVAPFQSSSPYGASSSFSPQSFFSNGGMPVQFNAGPTYNNFGNAPYFGQTQTANYYAPSINSSAFGNQYASQSLNGLTSASSFSQPTFGQSAVYEPYYYAVPTPAPAASTSSSSSLSSLLPLLLLVLLEGKNQNNASATPSGDTVADDTVWGDPHFKDKNGVSVDDQIASGTNTLLLKTSDNARIIGQTGDSNHAKASAKEGTQVTVFTENSIDLGDGTKVLFKADGSAYHVNSDGSLGAALTDGEKVTSSTNPNDSITYSASGKKVTYSFDGQDGSQISGTMQANIDSTGNYIDTSVSSSSGSSFSGLLPALKDSFTGVKVDPKTGAGAFKPAADGSQQTNADFQVASLYS